MAKLTGPANVHPNGAENIGVVNVGCRIDVCAISEVSFVLCLNNGCSFELLFMLRHFKIQIKTWQSTICSIFCRLKIQIQVSKWAVFHPHI